jgi:hypothetical protein
MKRFVLNLLFASLLAGCSSLSHHPENEQLTVNPMGGDAPYPVVNLESYQPVEFNLPNEEDNLDQKCHALSKLREYNIISDQEFLEKLPFSWDF